MLDSYSLCTRLDSHSQPIYRAGGNRIPEACVSTERKRQGILSPVRNLPSVNGVTLDKVKTMGPLGLDSKQVRWSDLESLFEECAEYYPPTHELPVTPGPTPFHISPQSQDA